MKIMPHSLWGKMIVVFAGLFALTSVAFHYRRQQQKTDYSRLVEFILLEDKDAPLYVFDDFEKGFEKDPYQASLDYFNEHPGLIRRIRSDLGGGPIRWRLEALEHRQLFVPEKRPEYATLFEEYSNEAIRFALDKTDLDNPYDEIRTLQQEKPQLPETNDQVTVFVVHNLIQEYVSTYVFTNLKRKKIRIRLTTRISSGRVGSYSTNLYLREDGGFDLVSDVFTIWQNSAENPYTALMAPVEETLHIAIRKHTERVIKEKLVRNSVEALEEAERIANDWLAVEEALVGGLVYSLLPAVLEEHMDNLSDVWIEKDIESKSKLRRYRYLRKGIEIVQQLGSLQAVKMYKKDPRIFKNLLAHSS